MADSFGLMLSLASAFSAKAILVCLEPSSVPDADLEVWTSRIRQSTNSIGIMFGHKLPQSKEKLLVYSPNECYRDMLDNDTEIMQDNVWLVPETNELPPNLRLDSEFITFHSEGQNMTLKDHYRIKGGKAHSHKIGQYSDTEGLSLTTFNKYERRSNFGFPTLSFNTVPWMPLIKLPNRSFKTVGMMPDVMIHLRNLLNFDMTSTKPRVPAFGNPFTLPNGTRTSIGIIGQLMRKEVDASLVGISVSALRSSAVDFTIGVDIEPFTLIVKEDALKATGINMTAYLSVFGIDVWLCILLLLITSAICLAIIIRYSEDSSNFGLDFIWGIAYSSRCLMHVTVPLSILTKICLRLATVSVIFACLVVYSAYTGDLTAKLTTGSAQVKLRNFQDVLDNGFRLYVTKGNLIHALLSGAPEGTIQAEVFRKNTILVELDQQTTAEGLIKLIEDDPKGALFGNLIGFPRDRGLKSIDDFVDRVPTQVAFAFQKDSEFTTIFSHHINKMREQGVLEQLYHQWVNRDTPKDVSHRIFSDESAELGYGNLFFPMLVLGLGMAGGILLVMPEVLMFRTKKRTSGELEF